ncbi:MAG: PAS domain S-box protein [Sphingosinicella sp.]|uniref:PAS domain S-box protein n=1 Tax=Sphingosinicella sp. TaxID=1917971 RepID=UPI004037BED9
MDGQTSFSRHVLDQRFQLLVNAVTDYALYMLEPDGRIASWNAGARRLKGYEAEEIIGEHYSRFFTEEDRASGLPQRALATAAREGRFEAEGLRVRKDGTLFWANAVVDPIRDDNGRLIGFAKITRDITERREAERALHASERQFRLLVQGVKDYAIYMLDPEGYVSNWNAGAEAIKGYKADEIVGRHFSQFYTEEDRESGEPARALRTALEEGKYEKEAWRVRKDGGRFWAHVLIDPIHDDHGRHIGFAKVTRDATERRKAQEELEEARASLFQAQKLQAIGELTGGIAHDFNNLMTVIRGSAELLRATDLSAEKRERYLMAIIETADRAATLTSHLLAFGRRQPLKPETIDLNLRLDAFAEVVARTIGSRIEVTLDLAKGLWPVEVDSAQLETALLNAAINARDAMPGGGRLILSSRNIPGEAGDPDMVCIALSDTGAGIEAEVLERVFDPFFTTKPVGKGTGLGLSQIHGFAAQSGGRAEIESAVGEGTTLHLLLPRARAAIPTAPPIEAGLAAGRGATVLLVEDNDQVRDFAESLIAELGYRVLSSVSGEAALLVLENEPVDLLFTDVVMPGMDGIALARRARELRPDLPVLLASGYSEQVANGGATEFETLAKPYGVQSLGRALATARARREAVSTA